MECCKMYARLVIGDFMMVMAFLSVLETTPTFSRNCALLGLCGKVRTSTKPCKLWKTKVVVARQALGAAPRLPTAALTQTKFRKRLKHVERGNHVEKLRRNSLNLQFQKFHISIDAMHMNIDAKGWFMIGASKREYTFRNNVWQDYFQEFMGINGARTNRQCGRSIIL